MRVLVVVFGLVLSLCAPAFAQEWDVYTSTRDGFKIDFPGQPKITDTTWTSEYGYILPARIYSADSGGGHYSMTVVDYTPIQQLGVERSKKCPAGAETCQGQLAGALYNVIGPSYAIQDIRGALVYASFKFLQRNAKVTGYIWNWEDLVEGHQIDLTSNVDGSRTEAFIAMRENKLYIAEGTVPKGYPEPELFQQSIGWVDKDGNGVRYSALYSNEFHGLRIIPPPSYGGGVPAAAGGAPPAPPAPAPIESFLPKRLEPGQTTVVNVAVPGRNAMIQSAEISPAAGITISGIKPGVTSQGNVWWELTVAVAKNAAPGDRTLTLVTPTARLNPLTITIPNHVPSISGLKVVSAQANQPMDIQFAASDQGGTMGDAPYVWFALGCGGDPEVGVVPGRVAGGNVRATIPNLHPSTGPGHPAVSKCELQVRASDSSGIDSNTLTTDVLQN